MSTQIDTIARTARPLDQPGPARRLAAFTITELLVVIGLLALLTGLLFVALNAATDSGKMVDSMNRMRQIGTWMTAYSTDHRETIVPSRFDYSGFDYKGKVRSIEPAVGPQYAGTWTDILWTLYAPKGRTFKSGDDEFSPYLFDSPDAAYYLDFPEADANPFRSAAQNTLNAFDSSDGIPRPFGEGAHETGDPGYFAANDSFDSTGGNWRSTGQLKAPERTMYLVDSFAGETIAPAWDPFYTDLHDPGAQPPTLEVDFRYNDSCLMLFLDGHVSPEDDWQNLDILQNDRGIIVQN